MDASGLRERKKREVKERLCAAASRLFADEEPDAISVDRIAAAADVSRATFFNYFPSRGALLDELAARMIVRLDRELASVRAMDDDLEGRLLVWFRDSVATVRRHERLNRLLFARAFGDADERETRAAQMAEVHRAYGAFLEDAVARGELPATADVSFLAEQLAGAMTTLLRNWFNDPSHPLEERAERTARFYARALRSGGDDEPVPVPHPEKPRRRHGTIRPRTR